MFYLVYGQLTLEIYRLNKRFFFIIIIKTWYKKLSYYYFVSLQVSKPLKSIELIQVAFWNLIRFWLLNGPTISLLAGGICFSPSQSNCFHTYKLYYFLDVTCRKFLFSNFKRIFLWNLQGEIVHLFHLSGYFVSIKNK